MVDFSGREVQGDLVLSGACATCGGKVTRLIETGDPMASHPTPITLRHDISTVQLELDVDDLWIVLETLVQHGRPDLVYRYLGQLSKKKLLEQREVEILADHYDIEPPI